MKTDRLLLYMGFGLALLMGGLSMATLLPARIVEETVHPTLDHSNGNISIEMRIAYPQKLWVGERGMFRLVIPDSHWQLDVDQEKTHAVVEARLEIPGMETSPGGAVEIPLQPGSDLVFEWESRAVDAGYLSGTAWIYLDLVDMQDGNVEQVVLLAKRLEISSQRIVGMNLMAARIAGLCGTAAGILLCAFLIGKKLMK